MDIIKAINFHQSLREQFSGITSIALDLLTAKTYASLVHIRGTSTPGWMARMQYILLFQRSHKEALDKHALFNDDLRAFIESINHAYDVLQSAELSDEIKAILEWLYRTQIRSIFQNKQMKIRLFRRRQDMHENNPLRTFFLIDYINEEVYALLNNEEDANKAKHAGKMIAVPDNISELENSQIEYEKCFDVLCKAYGEADLKIRINHNTYMPQNLPVELRQALKNYYDAIWFSMDENKGKSPNRKPLPLGNKIKSKELLR